MKQREDTLGFLNILVSEDPQVLIKLDINNKSKNFTKDNPHFASSLVILYIDVICYSRDISTGGKTPTLAVKDCKAAIPLSSDFALKSQKSKYWYLIIACRAVNKGQ